MATKTIDLDFIPVNLDGEPLMSTTLAKVVGKLLCESTRDTEHCLERYLLGKGLYDTGKATFENSETPETLDMITYFKDVCNKYSGFSNEVKGQILLKFI